MYIHQYKIIYFYLTIVDCYQLEVSYVMSDILNRKRQPCLKIYSHDTNQNELLS